MKIKLNKPVFNEQDETERLFKEQYKAYEDLKKAGLLSPKKGGTTP